MAPKAWSAPMKNPAEIDGHPVPSFKRYRQFYFSFDTDLYRTRGLSPSPAPSSNSTASSKPPPPPSNGTPPKDSYSILSITKNY